MGTYVVIDLEMCRVAKEKRDIFNSNREIIQIGAVALNDKYEIVDSFMTYVKPKFGVIDTYIHNLTKISYNDVKNAPLFCDALKLFLSWLPNDAILVTWSENDIEQIYDEIELKGIEVPEIYDYLNEYIDCQEIFSEKMNTDKIYRLSEALNIACIDYDDNMHDALADANNTALLFAKTQKEDVLILSPYYFTVEEYNNTHYNSFATIRCTL